MVDYLYIEVRAPDRGVVQHKAATQIDDRECTDCENVWFNDGEIRKRFGYSSSLPILIASDDVASLGEEIVLMAEFNDGIDLARPSRRLVAVTVGHYLTYDESTNIWTSASQSAAATTSAVLNFDSNMNTDDDECVRWKQTTGSGVDDLNVSSKESATDREYFIRIFSVGATDTYEFDIAGGGFDDNGSAGYPVNVAKEIESGIWVLFSTQTGHTDNDVWTINAESLTVTHLEADATPYPVPTNTKHAFTSPSGTHIADTSGKNTVFFYHQMESGNFNGMNTIEFWIHNNADAWAAGDVKIRLLSTADSNWEKGIGAKYTDISIPALPKQTWARYSLSFAAISDTDYNNANLLMLVSTGADLSAKLQEVRMDDIVISNGSGLAGVNTKANPVSPPRWV